MAWRAWQCGHEIQHILFVSLLRPSIFLFLLPQTLTEASGPMFLQYAALEEEHGLAQAAKGVHDQAIAAKPSFMSSFLQRTSIFLFLLLQTPAEASGPVFLQYAALEEEHGLARAAMGVYDQAVRTVPTGERLPIYDVYLKRASDFFGIGKVSLRLGAP